MTASAEQIVDQLLEVDVKSMLSRALTPENIKRELVNLAVEAAELVLPIFERRYPRDKRPRKAIEAAKAWIADPSEENRKRANRAADAASNAANAAYAAADAAADAARAAWAAADADDAADAAGAAGWAADAAANVDPKIKARIAEIKERIEYLRGLLK